MEWLVIYAYHCLENVQSATEYTDTSNTIINCTEPLIRWNALNLSRWATFYSVSETGTKLSLRKSDGYFINISVYSIIFFCHLCRSHVSLTEKHWINLRSNWSYQLELLNASFVILVSLLSGIIIVFHLSLLLCVDLIDFRMASS